MIMSTAPVAEIIRADFSAMFEMTFQHLYGHGKYQHNWHHDYLARVVEQCLAGNHTRVIVALPPGHLKSTMMSVALPAFMLGRRPETKIIAASYSSDLAENFSTQTRSVMEASWYQEAFPQTTLATSQATLLKTTKHGSRTATSVGGKITGLRADAIIVDDPMNYMDASSPTKRAEVLKWFEYLATRLDHAKGVILLVMQRLHVDDLVANLLMKEGWHHVSIPLIATEAQSYDCGGFTHDRAAGEPIACRILFGCGGRENTQGNRGAILPGSISTGADRRQRPDGSVRSFPAL